MTTAPVDRPPRRSGPVLPDTPVVVPAPPEAAPPRQAQWTKLMMVLPVLVGGAATMLMFGQGGTTLTYVVGGLFAVSALAMLITGWGITSTGARATLAEQRREYLRTLARVRQEVHQRAATQRTVAAYHHRPPDQLWSLVDSHRRWERRADDDDFGVVRLGTGTRRLAGGLHSASNAEQEYDQPSSWAQQRFLDTYADVPALAITLALLAHASVRLVGDADAAGGLARAIVAQLAACHAPTDLRIAVCVDPARRSGWEWVKWLPHTAHPRRSDAVGPVRLVAGDVDRLELTDLAGPTGLVVVHDRAAPAPAIPGATVLSIEATGDHPGPANDAVWVRVSDAQLVVDADGEQHTGVADQLGTIEAEVLARQLARHRAADVDTGDAPPATDADDPYRFDPAVAWARRPAEQLLQVPIGTTPAGEPVLLDLKESAAGGMGPHGLLVGATGSGKSELLRTIVVQLATCHSSEELNLVLVDFKGGATFSSLQRLPHTAAVITNLVDELTLVDRMGDALHGELVRRQELLRRAGGLAGRAEYEHARAAGAPLPAMPVLLVICDEFSELLAARPELTDLFVQIGRLGRSLGVHLLLASQRLEEGRLRGLDAHLSYRLALRTFSSLESRTVLGSPEAYELPGEPGHGFLKAGTAPLIRFRAAMVSGPAPAPGDAAPAGPAAGHHAGGSTRPAVRVLPFGSWEVPLPEPGPAPPGSGPSRMEVLVARMRGAGPAAHQVWLPPLRDSPLLDALLGPVAAQPDRGLTTVDPDWHGTLRVPVAWVDKPFEQRREALVLALDGGGGHVAVVGGPRSGKSTLLHTLVCALALTHTPAEVHIYCVDFGGGGLTALAPLPHVGTVAGRHDTAVVRRTIAEVATRLAERERADAGSHAYPRVVLVIDGWANLAHEFDDLEATVVDLAARGLAYGIHIVVSAARWLELRPAVRDLLGSRVELRLGEPADSLAPPRAAATVPEGAPGRGITADGRHLLTALPRLRHEDDLVQEVAAAWSGPTAPPVRLLPAQVPVDQVEVAGGDLTLPIGIGESDLGPVSLDFDTEPHLVLFGDGESGKSSFLRLVATLIARRLAPQRARLVLVDYRRSLLGTVTAPHLIGYGTAAEPAAQLVESVASYLHQRLPPAEVTPQQLRERSWWQGPECFVLVDDYDLVATGGVNPLLPLLPYLPQARDVGLHLVVARRSGGAGRAMYEPVLQSLRDLATPGLVLSGDPDEGALVGQVRPEPLPPGRARLVTRRHGTELVQLSWLAPQ